MHILGGESYALKKLESYTVEAYCSHSVITGLFNCACDIRRMLVIHGISGWPRNSWLPNRKLVSVLNLQDNSLELIYHHLPYKLSYLSSFFDLIFKHECKRFAGLKHIIQIQRQTGNFYEILGGKNRKNNFVVPYVSGATLNSFFEAVVIFRNIPIFCFLYTCSNPTLGYHCASR